MQMTLWSIVAMSQFALTGKATFYATRSILGILEVNARPGREVAFINHLIHREASFPISSYGFHTFTPVLSYQSALGESPELLYINRSPSSCLPG